jgi:hypothetical protein
MTMSDDIRKTLSDPKPLYALAGAGDLAAEKLKDAPDRLKDAPALLAEASAALSTLATRIAADAPEHFAKVSATVQETVGKAARPDTAALRERAQMVAIQQVGRLLEAAGKAVETYDELAERGRVVVGRYAGSTDTVPGEAVDSAVTVVVEQMDDEDELVYQTESEAFEDPAEDFIVIAESESESDEAAEPESAQADAAQAGSEAETPAPKKTARKRAGAPKAAQPEEGGAQ